MGFVFPKEILKLILMRVLELEYSERKKKTKILKLFNNYLLKFKVNKHHRRIWVTIPENKRVIHFSEIYINKYRYYKHLIQKVDLFNRKENLLKVKKLKEVFYKSTFRLEKALN